MKLLDILKEIQINKGKILLKRNPETESFKIKDKPEWGNSFWIYPNFKNKDILESNCILKSHGVINFLKLRGVKFEFEKCSLGNEFFQIIIENPQKYFKIDR